MIVRDFVANHGFDIGHRRLVKDEVWCRMQFRDEADLHAYAVRQRWSAFRFVDAAASPAATPEPAAVQAESRPKGRR